MAKMTSAQAEKELRKMLDQHDALLKRFGFSLLNR